MNEIRHESATEPEIIATTATPTLDSSKKANGIVEHIAHIVDDDDDRSNEGATTLANNTVPTSKDISEKLILDKIGALNIENHELKMENTEFKSKVAQLEKACAELKVKSDRATASIESVKRELQSMVIKYATSEKEVINLKKHYADSDRKCKDVLKERDALQTKIKELSNEKKQLLTSVERKILEAATLRNENELLKNKLAQADVRVEQLNLQLIEITAEYKQAKEKLERIESGLGQLSQLSQTSSQRLLGESVAVSEQAQFKLVDDDINEEEQSPGTQALDEEVKQSDLTNNWTDQYLQCIERNKQLISELELVTRERAQYKDHIDGLEAKLAEARDQMKDYSRKVELIESLKNELINKQNAIDSLKDKFDQINSINRDLVGDIDSSKHKEGELLEYTERLTAKLVSLQSEHNILTEKLKCTETQCRQLKEDHTKVVTAHEMTKSEFEKYKSTQEDQLERLRNELQQKTSQTEELNRKIDELENNIKIVKRKHIASLKELNKEIQALKKQRDEQTKVKATPASTEANSSTLSSRTNSFNSLSEMMGSNICDSVGQFVASDRPETNCNNNISINNNATNLLASSQVAVAAATTNNNNNSNTNSLSESTTSSSSNELITSLNDIDKNVLIERILRLQRTLIKRNEKIDFLEEHNEQLTEEVRKKSKLLQYYILKEETGALATETMDKNKAYLSRRGGGIMASLYNSSSTDDTMTLERSLEINNKLHAVLEDTLLKNMTLKENLNTLASEIDRLSKKK